MSHAAAGDAPTERPALLGSWAVRASILGWVFAAIGLAVWAAGGNPRVVVGAYFIAIVSASSFFARDAVSELVREREVGIELLMTLAIAAAAALGQWREAALVACLYSITEALEGFTIQKTRWAIRGLMDTVPPTAHLLRGDDEIEVDVKEIRPGDRIRIRPGESMGVDGIVRDGRSTVDESAVTGESVPVERGPGDKVVAGTLNGNGVLVVEATTTFENNTVANIIKLVENAQASKGKSQLFVERFGRIYSPAVLAATVLLIVVPVLFGADAKAWALMAVSFLVAASPCALAVATPVTLVAAIGAAAKRGILIKGGVILESLGQARAIALDKTGTLTHGRPKLTGLHAITLSDEDVLGLAASIEQQSEHPLASAIVEGARSRGVTIPDPENVVALTAEGVTGRVGGREVFVLKPAGAKARGFALDAAAQSWLLAAQQRGETAVVVAVDNRAVGVLALSDTIRPEAAELVRQLTRSGVTRVIMLTGDNEATGQAIGRQVGITDVHAGLLPEHKVARVKALRESYGVVIMVGDGINDAPALAAASVGIAMGTRGSDAALAAADVALMADDLSKLEEAVLLGRKTRRIIAQNLVMSGLIVVVLVAGTLFGDLSMFGAVLGHEGSEVFIVLNGLRAALK